VEGKRKFILRGKRARRGERGPATGSPRVAEIY
jgi:hypothetical protein